MFDGYTIEHIQLKQFAVEPCDGLSLSIREGVLLVNVKVRAVYADIFGDNCSISRSHVDKVDIALEDVICRLRRIVENVCLDIESRSDSRLDVSLSCDCVSRHR